MDDFWSLLLLLIGLAIGIWVSIFGVSINVSDGTFDWMDEEYIHVDSEQEGTWCEDWVCEEWKDPECPNFESWGHWSESPYSGELEFYCCNQPRNTEYSPNCYLTGRNKECVSEKLVRRRC